MTDKQLELQECIRIGGLTAERGQVRLKAGGEVRAAKLNLPGSRGLIGHCAVDDRVLLSDYLRLPLTGSSGYLYCPGSGGDASWRTPSTGSGGGGGDQDAEYILVNASSSLPNSRGILAGNGLYSNDQGAGLKYILNIDNSVVATITGSQFIGPVIADGGLTGSLQKTSAGLSYLMGGGGVTVISQSNGQITIGCPTVPPVSAQYLTLALDSTLTGERQFVANGGLQMVDGGAGSTLQVKIDTGSINGYIGLVTNTVNGLCPSSSVGYSVLNQNSTGIGTPVWTNIPTLIGLGVTDGSGHTTTVYSNSIVQPSDSADTIVQSGPQSEIVQSNASADGNAIIQNGNAYHQIGSPAAGSGSLRTRNDAHWMALGGATGADTNVVSYEGVYSGGPRITIGENSTNCEEVQVFSYDQSQLSARNKSLMGVQWGTSGVLYHGHCTSDVGIVRFQSTVNPDTVYGGNVTIGDGAALTGSLRLLKDASAWAQGTLGPVHLWRHSDQDNRTVFGHIGTGSTGIRLSCGILGSGSVSVGGADDGSGDVVRWNSSLLQFGTSSNSTLVSTYGDIKVGDRGTGVRNGLPNWMSTRSGEICTLVWSETDQSMRIGPSPFCTNIAQFSPARTTTISQHGLQLTTSGTVGTPNIANTNFITRQRRIQMTSATAANEGASIFTDYNHMFISTTAGMGLNQFCWRGVAVESMPASGRGFWGLSNRLTAWPGNQAPSGMKSCIGVGFDTGDTTLQLYSSTPTSPGKVSLGSQFPITGSSYDIVLRNATGSTAWQVQVTRLDQTTRTVFTATVTSPTPTNNTGLAFTGFMNNGGSTGSTVWSTTGGAHEQRLDLSL